MALEGEALGPIARVVARALLPVVPVLALVACVPGTIAVDGRLAPLGPRLTPAGLAAQAPAQRLTYSRRWDLGTAPYVELSLPGGWFGPDAALRLAFSRPMSRASVETSFRIEPAAAGVLAWADDRTMEFRPAALEPQTTYEVSVAGLSMDRQSLVGARFWAFTTPGRVPPLSYPFTLTFDDCGTPAQIQAILNALAAKRMHAIFFPTGWCRDQYPWLIPTLQARGHWVCNHTYSHLLLTRLNDQQVADQIARGVHAGCGLFRPPYGAWDGPRGRIAAIAARQGYRVQLWDVDTRDWAGTPAAAMVSGIHARGGVVLMHMFGAHTAEAILAL